MIDQDQVTSEFVTSLAGVAFIADRDDLQKGRPSKRVSSNSRSNSLGGGERERFVIAIEEIIEVVLDGAKSHAIATQQL